MTDWKALGAELFAATTCEWRKAKPTGIHATIHCDGSCPSNPGDMGIGYVIRFADLAENERPIEVGTRFGRGSNNQAEYLALIFACRHAHRIGVTHAKIFMDSQLVVNQVEGHWTCRDGLLKPLLEEACGLLRMFAWYDLRHVYREENGDADWLSHNPTDDTTHPAADLEVPVVVKPRKLSRPQAAMIRWWWKTHRCRNEYRLARIFNATPSHMGRIGRGEQYKDITTEDLPCHTSPKPSETSSTSY